MEGVLIKLEEIYAQVQSTSTDVKLLLERDTVTRGRVDDHETRLRSLERLRQLAPIGTLIAGVLAGVAKATGLA